MKLKDGQVAMIGNRTYRGKVPDAVIDKVKKDEEAYQEAHPDETAKKKAESKKRAEVKTKKAASEIKKGHG